MFIGKECLLICDSSVDGEGVWGFIAGCWHVISMNVLMDPSTLWLLPVTILLLFGTKQCGANDTKPNSRKISHVLCRSGRYQAPVAFSVKHQKRQGMDGVDPGISVQHVEMVLISDQ